MINARYVIRYALIVSGAIKHSGIGAAYKPTISRGKNSNLRWRFGADLGANRKGFQASIDIGLEYSYSFRNGMQVFVMQKNDFVFLDT